MQFISRDEYIRNAVAQDESAEQAGADWDDAYAEAASEYQAEHPERVANWNEVMQMQHDNRVEHEMVKAAGYKPKAPAPVYRKEDCPF